MVSFKTLRDIGRPQLELYPPVVGSLLREGFLESTGQLHKDKYVAVKAALDRHIARVRVKWMLGSRSSRDVLSTFDHSTSQLDHTCSQRQSLESRDFAFTGILGVERFYDMPENNLTVSIEPRTFSIDEAAVILGIGRNSAYRAVNNGLIRAIDL